ncbi:MAG: hypothetical protein JWQ14_2116, partial [Adhaeribacter sp.]|nr:hypothetical protein [Adhaeribacter sp.]
VLLYLLRPKKEARVVVFKWVNYSALRFKAAGISPLLIRNNKFT